MAKKARKKSAVKAKKKKKSARPVSKKRRPAPKKKAPVAARKKKPARKGVIATIAGAASAVVDTLTEAERLHHTMEPHVSPDPE